MTKETVQIGGRLLAQIEQIYNELNQMNILLDDIKGEKVTARVGAITVKIPKAAFKAEIQARKAGLQTQLTTLQNEFDAL